MRRELCEMVIYDFSLFPPPIQGPVLLCLWRDLCQMLVSKNPLRWTKLENKRIFLWIKKRFPETWASCKRKVLRSQESSEDAAGNAQETVRRPIGLAKLLGPNCGTDVAETSWTEIRTSEWMGDWWQDPLETWSLCYILGRLREETPRSTEAVRSWRRNPVDILKIKRCQCF